MCVLVIFPVSALMSRSSLDGWLPTNRRKPSRMKSNTALGPGKQDLAEVREMRTAPAALEQAHAEPLFERSNRLGHGGLGQIHRRRRAADALMPGHGLENMQLP
jgi:hypothetical protein